MAWLVTQLRCQSYCAIAFDLIRNCVHMIRMPLEDNLQTSVAKACRTAGGQAALARQLGIRQSTVSSWLRRGNELPAKFVIPVEQAFGISRHELRPDLYPIVDPAAPAQHPPALSPLAQRPAAHPSASASCHPQGQDADGSHPALDYPGADPLKGLAA